MKNRKFGWKKDQLDPRDKPFIRPKLFNFQTIKLKDSFALAPLVDQKDEGSCTGNGIATAIGFDLLNKHSQGGGAWFQPSRNFIYWNERDIEGTVQWDSGAEIRDGIKSVASLGVCSEKTWPYNTKQFRKKPSAKAYAEALNFQAIEYRRIDNTDKAAIVQALYEGFPVVFGFLVFESFYNAEKTGVIPMPNPSKEKILGGHCMVVDGFDFSSDRGEGPNSWGETWGNKGRFTIPMAYLTDPTLASDFWIINLIE